MRTKTTARLAAGVIGVVFFAAGMFFALPSPPPPEYTGKRFVLQSVGGEVTEADFAGKPFALMFGFTHCPDFCPAGLAKMRLWRDALGNDKNAVRFAFITVDPARDNPALLARYVAHFSADILALSGGEAQVDAALKAFGVYAEKAPLPGGGYTMDHDTSVFLFNADGGLRQRIYYADDRQTALKKLRALIAASRGARERILRAAGIGGE